MTKEQVLAQQRADFAVAKFIEEILGSGHIKKCTRKAEVPLAWIESLFRYIAMEMKFMLPCYYVEK